ncbi:MAG: YceI family protein [Bacteroidota bacterium]|nr:YceI family protein [Bacteroidota bacterium]
MKKIILLVLCSFLISTLLFSQNNYTFDKNHARLSFSVIHLGISNVEGIFKTFDVKFVTKKEDFTDARIEMTADVKSINTDIEMRDNDLRDSWFDVAKYPILSFKSTSFKKIKGNRYQLKGNITIHGVTKPITFDVIYNGKVQNPSSKKYLCGFTITGKLNRNDFGVGKELIQFVSNEVEVKSNVEFIID